MVWAWTTNTVGRIDLQVLSRYSAPSGSDCEIFEPTRTESKMGIVECSPAILETAGKTLDAEGPVYMVNMVRYRDHADYRGKSEFPPCSGREAYFQRYAPAFNNVARGEDYGLFWVGNVRGVLVGAEGENWDNIVIVRYSSFAALRRILESSAYEAEAAPHRRAALADWRFIVTTQPNPPK
jgi:uncharacterized protein (DUF1330 family)